MCACCPGLLPIKRFQIALHSTDCRWEATIGIMGGCAYLRQRCNRLFSFGTEHGLNAIQPFGIKNTLNDTVAARCLVGNLMEQDWINKGIATNGQPERIAMHLIAANK